MRVSDLPTTYPLMTTKEITTHLVANITTPAGIYFGLHSDYKLFNSNAFNMQMECLENDELIAQLALPEGATLQIFLLMYLFKMNLERDTLFNEICDGSPFSLNFTVQDFLQLDTLRLSDLPIKWKFQAFLNAKTTVPFDYPDKPMTWQYSQMELEKFYFWAVPDSYDIFANGVMSAEFFQNKRSFKAFDNVAYFWVKKPEGFDWTQFKDIQPGSKHILRIVFKTEEDALWYGGLMYCAQHSNKSQYAPMHTYHCCLYACGYTGYSQESIDYVTAIFNEKLEAERLTKFDFGKDNLRKLKRLRSAQQ